MRRRRCARGEPAPPEASPDQPGRSRHARTALAVGLVIVVLAGLVLRIWALGREPINSDEAVVGLMAHEILHGHFFAYYWGQDYGGGEPYVAAAVFAVLGQSRFTLGFAPVILDAVAALLVWRIGRRLFGPGIGIAAGVLFWVFPEVYIWQSTIEYGFRWVTLDCGLTIALLSLRRSAAVAPSPRLGTRIEWLGLGLALGVGWWSSPEIVYFVVPATVVFVVAVVQHETRIRVGDGVVALFGLGLGALPWLWTNVPNGFPSLRRPQPVGTFASHLNVLRDHIVPTVLGLQLPISGKWLLGRVVGETAEYLAIAGGIVYLFVLVQRRQALYLAVFLALFPFVYAYSPFTWYWQDGRYAVYLAPMMAIALAAIGGELARQSRVPLRLRAWAGFAPAAVVAVGLGLTLAAASEIQPFAANRVDGSAAQGWTSWQSDPDHYIATLDQSLEAHGVRRLFAGYWLAYSLAFESRGALVASDVRYSRYQPYLSEIEAGGEASWLFVDASASLRLATLSGSGSALLDPACAIAGNTCLTAQMLEDYLHQRHIAYATTPLDSLGVVVVRPERPVSAPAVISFYHLEG